VNDPSSNLPNNQLQFLRELVEEHASVAGDIVRVGHSLWAIHGFFPVDCDVLMAEFDSYDQATNTLAQLSPRSRRRDDFSSSADRLDYE